MCLVTPVRLVVVLGLAVAGCGADTVDQTDRPAADGIESAPAGIGGSFLLTDWTGAGQEIAVDDPSLLVLEAEFGSAALETSCGIELGAYSLLDDGRAGFTLAGGRSVPCSVDAARQQTRLRDTLGTVDAWTVTNDTLTLRGPSAVLRFDRV